MIININSGSSGWGNYVLYGTKDKPRDNSKVELLDGDISLGDYYSKNNKYEDSYYTVVLGFKGKPSKEVIEGAYSDFKEQFFKGFREDEYHIDAVIHYDTDDTHIHARIPKQNLLTNTHLQLYYDKIDRPRKELIQDYISLKYGLEIARETNKEIVKEQSHEYINKWREERNQEPFNFSNKKGKDLAEKQINSYISDLITSNMIEKQEDIRTVLEELDLEVIKFDRDIKKDFAYVTVQNDTGKMRIKGEFYDGEFFSYNAKDRRTQIESNQRIKEHTEPTHERFTRVQRELRKANEKRYDRVTELFRASRERAINQIKTTTSKAIEINRQSAGGELGNNRELTKSTDNQNISNSSNIRDNNRDNINDNDKTLSNRRQEQHSTREQNRTVTDIQPTITSMASTERVSDERKAREIHSSTKREHIHRTRGQNLHQDRGIDDTYRTTTYERDRAIRKERTEAIREARRTRVELYKSITEQSKQLRESTISNSRELPNNYTEYADRTRRTIARAREQQQENIKQSTHHISTTQSNANELTKLARFKQRVSSYIKVAREHISNAVDKIKDTYNNHFNYKSESLETNLKQLNANKEILGKETSFKDLRELNKTFEAEQVRDNIKHEQKQQQQRSRSYDYGYSR